MVDTDPRLDNDASSPRKRRERTSGMYRRKRAVAACQQCRLRKTKCDNARPTCGFCQRNNGQCIYQDGGPSDYSSFDPASLAILDRVNHVVSLLESGNPRMAVGGPCGPSPSSSYAPHSEEFERTRAGEISLDDPEFTAATVSCESILRWPIFRGLVPEVRSFVLEAENDDANTATDRQDERPGSLGRGVQEDDFIALSKKFLAYVHVKNPILDIATYKAHVREAAENGPSWDAPSCLVLISCALACLSSPFQPDPVIDGTPDSNRSSVTTTVDRSTASSYYLAAKKRLGLLEPSIIQVQCLFLCAVFEMYSLRPLRAWFYFNQASVNFQNVVWKRLFKGNSQEPETRRLEQRLYWSCLKSEIELRVEIPLPSSGITRFDYPDAFPTPPSELTSPSAHQHSLDSLGVDIEPEEERSWFYYLAEISYRRMMNRAYSVMRRHGEQGWISDIGTTIKQYEDFNEQIKFWCSHIPPQIDLHNREVSNNELAYFVNYRVQSSREWIHRPFLYYVIHQPPDDPNRARVQPLADTCLELCVELVFYAVVHHRHHGSWYVARKAATCTLLLLAAARSGKFSMPERWREAVDVATRTVHHWSGEAVDLERSAAVLEDLVADTYSMPSVAGM
ncbi:vegetative cell wall protein gp1 [Camillea tinctor]|nr:vegetative cell wall protein gp1 [Camillea tinctor]